jgi:hypothetical protein
MIAGHKKALVEEYHETGTIDRRRMRSLGAVQSECGSCSNKEGGMMSRYSRIMNRAIQEIETDIGEAAVKLSKNPAGAAMIIDDEE